MAGKNRLLEDRQYEGELSQKRTSLMDMSRSCVIQLNFVHVGGYALAES
jgi:hypothetical protein